MDITAKQELARAYNRTVEIHEASYIDGTGRYGVAWMDAAHQACDDPDLIPIVYAMAAGGMSDYADWAIKFAK